ncbi:MAG TPA: hypothetical protein VFB23_10175 [Candidatus Acidoferrales bacterium]|nr:hypothetical protein [Candidatus Acidoferrales bacterium]
MNQTEENNRVDRLVRQRCAVEQTLTALKAAVRQLLRDHAGFDRVSVIARQIRTAIKVKRELEKQLAQSHSTVRFVYPFIRVS